MKLGRLAPAAGRVPTGRRSVGMLLHRREGIERAQLGGCTSTSCSSGSKARHTRTARRGADSGSEHVSPSSRRTLVRAVAFHARSAGMLNRLCADSSNERAEREAEAGPTVVVRRALPAALPGRPFWLRSAGDDPSLQRSHRRAPGAGCWRGGWRRTRSRHVLRPTRRHGRPPLG